MQTGIQLVEHGLDGAVVIASALVVAEYADHYCCSSGHQFARVVALLAVALKVRHVAVQPLRYPLLHERCIVVQPLSMCHSTVVKSDC